MKAAKESAQQAFAKLTERWLRAMSPGPDSAEKGQADTEELDELRKCLDRGLWLSAQDQSGLSLLCWASRLGKEKAARLLISRGARVNLADREGFSPLHWAALCPKPEAALICAQLIGAGAQIEALDSAGKTPLHRAMWGHEDSVKALLDAGANPLARCALGRSALEEARLALEESDWAPWADALQSAIQEKLAA